MVKEGGSMSWIKDRLKEKSTYIGLSLLLGSCGVVVAPEYVEIILGGVMAIAGAAQAVKKENES